MAEKCLISPIKRNMIVHIRILFVCHGNICRSTMAQSMFSQMIKEKGIEERFLVNSAAVSTEEIGNGMYPPARACLQRHGVEIVVHNAVQITANDAQKYDWIICMDKANMRGVYAILGDRAVYVTPSDVRKKFEEDPAAPYSSNGMIKARVCKVMDFAGVNAEVADPWYTGDFERTYYDLKQSLEALLSMVC